MPCGIIALKEGVPCKQTVELQQSPLSEPCCLRSVVPSNPLIRAEQTVPRKPADPWGDEHPGVSMTPDSYPSGGYLTEMLLLLVALCH